MKRGKRKSKAQLDRNIYINVRGAAAHQTEERKLKEEQKKKEESP